jgi:hypothetical protein
MSESIFTRRAYRAIADLIAHRMAELDQSGRQYVAERLSDLFAGDNARFDRSRFLKAAGVRDCEPLASRKAPTDGAGA